jgi:FKBP-type peptidyl-prolyl cis-trans isomerase
MKLKYLTPLAAVAFVTTALADHPTPLKDQRDKASYSIGVNIGGGIKSNALDLNTEALIAGIQDGIAGAKPQLTDKEREETLTAFEQEMKWSSIQDPRRREGAQPKPTDQITVNHRGTPILESSSTD